MKVNYYEYPKSSILGMPKDAFLIMNKILSNQTILKLIKYNVPNWKDQPLVTENDIDQMIATKQISSVPKIKIDKDKKTYLRLTYGMITPNNTNPEYDNNTFSIDILCHYDDWDLGNYEMRPYRIAGEIDAILNKSRLTGIGRLEKVSITPVIYNNEYAGVTLTYLAIRGIEDRINPLE